MIEHIAIISSSSTLFMQPFNPITMDYHICALFDRAIKLMSVDATVSNIVEMYSVYAFYCASVVKCRSYSSVQQRSSDNNNSDNDLISVRHTNFVANLAELHRQNRAEI